MPLVGSYLEPIFLAPEAKADKTDSDIHPYRNEWGGSVVVNSITSPRFLDGGVYYFGTSSRRTAPYSRPSEPEMMTAVTLCRSIYLAISSRDPSSRHVDGPGSITLPTVVCWSAESASFSTSPSTTRSSFTTTHICQPVPSICVRAVPTVAVKRQVGTSRRAIVPARGWVAAVPSLGRPLASQSALPAT